MPTPSDACIAAFERQYDTTWADPALRNERLSWIACWKAASACQGCAVQQGYVPVGAVAQIQDASRLPEIKDMLNSPQTLNNNDRAFWVLGWNECRDAAKSLIAHIAELEAQLAAVQQGVQPVDGTFFSFDPCEGLEIHNTADAAQAKAQAAIDLYREDAAEGWAEEVEGVCWGLVIGSTKEVELKEDLPPDAFASGCAEYIAPVDYVLAATHTTQQGLDAQRWQIVHNRISGEYIAGRAHFVVQLAPVPDTNIMRGSVAEHFTKAVDFAAAQAKQGDQANG